MMTAIQLYSQGHLQLGYWEGGANADFSKGASSRHEEVVEGRGQSWEALSYLCASPLTVTGC